ncbi:LOW QUALITY PROTEIN: NAD kinase 2, chloroplastic-like [Cucurbita maxima]|uniref:NAD(+) kinase n=1 Tax=Cucurbita maxima TaxID=3661 RepID=A0A6J1JQZ5_CUCMA|nr:LOW QUALITY PROTEIN: NAD kinase 2, chloroplastic-like [Cucurbita maxima]
MLLCCFVWHLDAIAVGMNRSLPATVIHSYPYLSPFRLLLPSSNNARFLGFQLHTWRRFRRRLKFAVTAELSKSVSFNSASEFQLSWMGPVPGDIAEVEAYCRIFRTAERLHSVLMDTLCNPFTGECSVSYDVTPGENPVIEDKIVSVLGCIVSLLNKGKEDVLSGRSSAMNAFRGDNLDAMEDNLPPLAAFRSEMKRCCESLHVALENFLTPDDDRSWDVWRKLQRLKNVCYDSGFPRGEDYPCHTLFANWNPVYLHNSKEEVSAKNSDVSFWSGGQITEEGLKWLIERGFKTIVDLRAETVKDIFYSASLHDAIGSDKVKVIRIPVEVRTAPTADQVEKFASLVSDGSNGLLYLHSKEGVWRTSAMISRWRQYATRSGSQFVSNQTIVPADIPLGDTSPKLVQNPNGAKESLEISTVEKTSSCDENSQSLLLESADHRSINRKNNAEADKIFQNENGAFNGAIPTQDLTSLRADHNGEEHLSQFSVATDPLKAQIPPCNIFSRKEMSNFFRTKKISPQNYLHRKMKTNEKRPPSTELPMSRVQKFSVDNSDLKSGLVEAGNTNGRPTVKETSSSTHYLSTTNMRYVNGDSHVSSNPVHNELGVDGRNPLMTEASTAVGDKFQSKAETNSLKSNGQATSVSSNDEMKSVEGNMCASATGVVRVQSRRKAEMFLVRTDGFSCAREKVTESSLAFTHPSTQQQMLMWKSTPRTVLLLKKLGEELMEEAKEVASFMYHQEKMNVLVEPDVHDIFARIPGFGFVQTFYSQDTSDLHEKVDFVACLGGDGVILHASNIFRGAVPPVVSFNLGSLGFLTSHTFDSYRQDLRQVIHGNDSLDGVYITLRMRLQCEIFRNGKAIPGKVFNILNEVVVDRGSNPYLSKIECYEHDRLITKVQGDGVIVATPTGSTAYSTAAGGSMVHPNVPCMLFTPICPHSLSFRPVILPDSARLELKIPEDARSNAWVSFDGKRRQQLSRGDSVKISMSRHPLPTVNKSDQTGDWFRSLIRCLNWNERLDQKAL